MDEEQPFIPPIIVTTDLLLSSITFRQENDEVVLMGLYADLETGDANEIAVETNFETLNNLLQYDNDDDYSTNLAVDRLVDRITSSEAEEETIFFDEDGGVNINRFILSLVPLSDYDEEGVYLEEDLTYMIAAYTPNKNIVPQFEFDLPGDDELPAYYRLVLAGRYAAYLALKLRFPEPVAAEFALLKDSLVFRIAEMEYQQVMNK
jgi:hypothetical protein